MRNGPGLMCFGGLMLIGGTSFAQQAKTVEVPEGLVGSPAFAKKVKVTCPGLAVGELLDQLSAKTGVKLRADKAIADDKVILFCPVLSREAPERHAERSCRALPRWLASRTDRGR